MAYRKIPGGQHISNIPAETGEVLKWNGNEYVPSPDNISDGTSGHTMDIILSATDISNKYIDLESVPLAPTLVRVTVVGGIEQDFPVDFVLVMDGMSELKRLSWDGLGLEQLLEIDDELIVEYN